MSRTRSGIFTRNQGGAARYYARFNGRRVALCPPGSTRATSDPQVAAALYGQLVAAHQKQQLRAVHGLPEPVALAAYSATHLVKKAQAGRVTEQALDADERHLARAAEFFGAERDLGTIDVPAVTGWISVLRDRGFGSDTILHHVHSLSNVFKRAQREGHVPLGYNPVSACEKPSGVRRERPWLEVPAASLLLEAARTYRPKCAWLAVPFQFELVASLLLTGGRPAEVLGLEVDDVSLERETVTFRPHARRRLKTLTSHRTVPLWPQLADILRPYFPRRDQLGPGTLLFPSYRTGQEGMLQHAHRIIAAVAARIGYAPGEVTCYTLRHTYTAARLQTLDNGAPVSPFSVGRELGHGGDALVRKVYGHLGTVRHRAPAVEYRVEQHAAKLRDKLAALHAEGA
jgi:integrase